MSEAEGVSALRGAVTWAWDGTSTGESKPSNLKGHLRILFGVFEWRYLLVPLGVVCRTATMQGEACTLMYDYREAFVFGVRVARWVVGTPKLYSPEAFSAKAKAWIQAEEENES